jgi:hypothetical protein
MYMCPYVVLQVVQDASSDGPAENPLLEGGSTPEERQASFLELALCLAAGLPDAALDPLFVVSNTPIVTVTCMACQVLEQPAHHTLVDVM